MALAVTGDCFSEEDCAAKILPAVCPLLIDKEKLVRDQAIKTMDIYLQKIKKAAAGMPDSALPPERTSDGGPRMSTPQPTESAAASWAGWAISSFTNKISAAAGEIQPSPSSNGTPSPRPEPKRPAQAPATSSASTLHRQALKSPPPQMSLSRASSSGAVGGDSFFADPEPADDDGDAWGDMDDGDGDGADFWDATSDQGGTQSLASSTTLPTAAKREKETTAGRTASAGSAAVASATPFDDAEPDFAGWLAAQAQRKSGGSGAGRPLPKGLAKPAAAKKPVVPTAAGKPAAKPTAKKIDLKPKAADDDDGWGDGW